MLDLAIIGGGPAALSAALYAARGGLRITAFERGEIGGDLTKIAEITNYPGFVGTGRELAKQLRQQAEAAGAKTEYGECSAVRPTEGGFRLTIDGEEVQAKKVLVATGSEPRTLDFALQVPVSYCALCDVDLARGEKVAVVGGGNSAVQEALTLAPLVAELTLVSHSKLKADQCLREKLMSQKNVEIKEGLEPTAGYLNGFDRVFVFIGRRPATQFLANLPEVLDAEGYIKVVKGHETAVPGLYAAGDVRANTVHQVITAAADGAAAAIEVEL